ncbi:MgtC/SapB family protein [Membranihabitans maritimus]|uniref:MgtC/SapB family protein n=1 Tax=Membranihabitans maritimus TaxID=2904244 RepID=UPI001F2463E8|nr:MgtC/SapB family protein [Membranihabitans maritimus]
MNLQWDILIDVALAIILGGIVGFEREWKKKPAGLRTNMLIAGASALFIALGRIIMKDYSSLVNIESLGIDPIRILHAVIVGVGFIGAGTILKSEDNTRIRYLTTAATIWMSAAIGLCVGLKQYYLAGGISLIILIINILFDYLGKWIGKVND